jgi:putative oxidoreductase
VSAPEPVTVGSVDHRGPPPPRRGPLATTILWLAKLAAAGILGRAAVMKLVSAPRAVEVFREVGMGDSGRYLIGGLEILAAILILIPQSAVYGALLGLGIMCGAVIGHLTVLGLAGLHMAVLVGACCVVILCLRRHDAEFLRNLFDR